MLITDIFPNATYDGANTKVQIPIADLGITAAQANAATGDIRAIMLAFIRKLKAAFDAADPAPASMTLTQGNATGTNTNTVSQAFSLGFPRVLTTDDLSLL